MKVRHFILILIVLISMPSAVSGSEVSELWTARKAVTFARQNSPESKQAAQRIIEAQALLQKASASFYPQIELSGNYSQTDNPMYSFGNILNQKEFSSAIDFNNPGRTDNVQVGIGVRYRFYNGGKDQAQKNAANAGVDLSAAESKMVGLNLQFEVFKAFQRIVSAEHLLRARQKSLEAVSSSLSVAQERYAAGDLLRLDLLNLEVEKSLATENLLKAQHKLELAQKVFLTLLGLNGDNVTVKINDTDLPIPPRKPEPNNRPELKKLTAALKAAEWRVAEAHGGHLPTVDGFARYQYDHGPLLDGNGDSWLAGVNLKFKLFDGYLTDAEIAMSKARLGVLRAEQIKLELALALEVNKAKSALELARQRLLVTQKTVEHALESDILSKARFNAGVLLVSERIDSQNRLTEARVRNLLASSALQIAIAELRRASGLPQFDEGDGQFTRVENQP